eukprot:TRINITY_DN12396_c0_g1_i1.p1 TRINITY_DN12396_c0_g1~~TRINITY_DN12396_c0_g1_i1.p1  ORF type:complete len:276 (-),score=51.50 TRINITY_DN12396_c0_g1_i1:37-813(-)
METKVDTSKEETKVFVSNLSPEVDEAILTDFFSFCGNIKKIEIRSANNADEDDDIDEMSRVAIVTFYNESSANSALLLSQALIKDRAITVELFSEQRSPKVQKREEPTKHTELKKSDISSSLGVPKDVSKEKIQAASNTIVISNLSGMVTDELFLKFFEFGGLINYYNIDRKHNIGLIEYSSKSCVNAALALNKFKLADQQLNLERVTDWTGDKDIIKDLTKGYVQAPVPKLHVKKKPDTPIICNLHQEYVPLREREK